MIGLLRRLNLGGNLSVIRHLSSEKRKRFYKNVSVVQNNGKFEINLDGRKLKTPLGTPFEVDNEALAHCVANEWLAQKEYIYLSQMHLTGLSNTCIDNPTNVGKEALVNSILEFLKTDTVLFYGEEPPALLNLQKAEWSPIINWFNQRYGVNVTPTVDISPPHLTEEDREHLHKHLMSYSFNAVQGISFGVDAIKSLILVLAVLDQRIAVKKAVELSRLELLYQTDQWGSVEWAHDIEMHDTTSRMAASNIFTFFHCITTMTRQKNIQS